MSSLAARFAGLPRAGKWTVVAGLALAAYFPLVEFPLELRARLESGATVNETRLREFERGAVEDSAHAADLALGVTRHGRPLPPRAAASSNEALDASIASVLEGHGIREYTTVSRVSSMTQGPLSTSYRDSAKLERSSRDVQFECPSSIGPQILSDLEREASVSCVPLVQMQSVDDGRRLRVRLTVEAWMFAGATG